MSFDETIPWLSSPIGTLSSSLAPLPGKRHYSQREAGQYPAGEDAMDKAEGTLAIPEHAANDPSTNAGVTVEQLRAQLDQIMKAEG